MKPLTILQKRFCEEYVKDYKPTDAYLRANNNNNANRHAASNCAYAMMQLEQVRDYIKQLQQEAVRQYGDIENLLIKQLVKDVVELDDEGKHNPSWSKSVDLLQKQLGLQKQNLKADVDNTVNIDVKVE